MSISQRLLIGASALISAAAIATAQAGNAHADDVYATSSAGRDGLTLGVGLALGHLGCADDNCDGTLQAGGINGHVGAMLDPNLALVADLWSMRRPGELATVDHSILTAALRYWPLERLWLSGGIGVAHASFDGDADVDSYMDENSTVPGLMGAVGLEVLHDPSFAVDVQLRAGTGVFDEDNRIRNYAIAVGASFY